MSIKKHRLPATLRHWMANMIYDFDAINNRRGGLSYKYNAVENDVLPLWVADMILSAPLK